MTNTMPRVTLDGRYSMKETAALLKIDRKTLYRWRKIGFIKTKIHRFTHMPFIEGREIRKVYEVCDYQKSTY